MQYVPNYGPSYANHEGFSPLPPTAPKVPEQKIVPKNYEHLEIKDSLNYGDL